MRPLRDASPHKHAYPIELIPSRRIAGGMTPEEGRAMRAFIRRFFLHYGINRRQPARRLTAARDAWRTART
jgi:hypothetical protein